MALLIGVFFSLIMVGIGIYLIYLAYQIKFRQRYELVQRAWRCYSPDVVSRSAPVIAIMIMLLGLYFIAAATLLLIWRTPIGGWAGVILLGAATYYMGCEIVFGQFRANRLDIGSNIANEDFAENPVIDTKDAEEKSIRNQKALNVLIGFLVLMSLLFAWGAFSQGKLSAALVPLFASFGALIFWAEGYKRRLRSTKSRGRSKCQAD